MENKINEIFKKYSKSVDTEYNVYNCLIEEDWQNITQDIVKLFAIPVIVGRSEQCCSPTDGFYLGTTCPHCNKPFRKNIK